MFHSGSGRRIYHRVLISLIPRNPIRNFLGNHLANLVAILPFDIAEQVVKGFDDIGQLIDFGNPAAAPPALVGEFFSDFNMRGMNLVFLKLG